MTFAECVAVGAYIGFKAFFAVVVFLLCVCTVLGLLTLVVSVFGGRGEDDMDRR
jgi:uncharacterized membrane protein (Fun14 family)